MAQVSFCYLKGTIEKIVCVSRKANMIKKSRKYTLVEFFLYIGFTLIASWQLVENRIILMRKVA